MGAIAGGGVALCLRRGAGVLAAAADAGGGRAGRHGVGRDPGAAAHALQHQRDPGQPDAGVHRAAARCAIWCTVRGATRPASTSRSRRCSSDAALLPLLVRGHARCNAAFVLALAGGAAAPGSSAAHLRRLPHAGRGHGAGAPRATPASARRATCGSALLVSGALAGLAGVGEVAGPIGQLQPSVSPGYGFAAIIVAFVGRLHPLGMRAVASLLMSLLYIGGEPAQISCSCRRRSPACSRACCCSTCWPRTCSSTTASSRALRHLPVDALETTA